MLSGAAAGERSERTLEMLQPLGPWHLIAALHVLYGAWRPENEQTALLQRGEKIFFIICGIYIKNANEYFTSLETCISLLSFDAF